MCAVTVNCTIAGFHLSKKGSGGMRGWRGKGILINSINAQATIAVYCAEHVVHNCFANADASDRCVTTRGPIVFLERPTCFEVLKILLYNQMRCMMCALDHPSRRCARSETSSGHTSGLLLRLLQA